MRKVVASAPSKPGHPRITRWQAPTGRWLQPGKRFKIKDVPGRRHMAGEWVFIAYVEAPTPYVECRKYDGGRSNVRAVDPARVFEVSNDVVEER